MRGERADTGSDRHIEGQHPLRVQIALDRGQHQERPSERGLALARPRLERSNCYLNAQPCFPARAVAPPGRGTHPWATSRRRANRHRRFPRLLPCAPTSRREWSLRSSGRSFAVRLVATAADRLQWRCQDGTCQSKAVLRGSAAIPNRCSRANLTSLRAAPRAWSDGGAGTPPCRDVSP